MTKRNGKWRYNKISINLKGKDFLKTGKSF